MNIFKEIYKPVSSAEIYSFRSYREKRLTKPKELRGVKRWFTAYLTRDKGAWQVFKCGNDLWINAKDFYSPSVSQLERQDRIEVINNPNISLEDKNALLGGRGANIHEVRSSLGMKPGRRKFTYADSYGSVIARQEAWVIFREFGDDIPKINSHYMSFYEHLVKEIAKLVNEDWCIVMYGDEVIRSIVDHVMSNKQEWEDE